MEDLEEPKKADINNQKDKITCDDSVFKKPLLLIGPRKGKFCKKTGRMVSAISSASKRSASNTAKELSSKPENGAKSILIGKSPAQKLTDNSLPIPYKEPDWGGTPEYKYSFEVLKSGTLLEDINLYAKSFFVFGRVSNCDIIMAHPTVSRFHAVLQYRSSGTNGNPKGFYIYDLESTHGTFVNKIQIKPKVYVHLRVGHMVRIGGSTRLFILQGPEEDMEEEAEITVTEMKQQKLERKLSKLVYDSKKIEDDDNDTGIDWGMGEDADEESDMTENPFALTSNEELFVNDPKKTLRGWFEREGYDLQYDVEEKDFGKFMCKVELPIDSAKGGSVTAEVVVAGKKKESVVQCALEACRILDRYGLLRQATHESKKRKLKNWEEDDFYDSDDDTFLDRTGTVEKKRHQRMKAAGKVDAPVETYESLLEKQSSILKDITSLEQQINEATQLSQNNIKEEEDSLDDFMSNLNFITADKKLISSLKNKQNELKNEEKKIKQLIDLVRPSASLASISELQNHSTVKKFHIGKKSALLKKNVNKSKPKIPIIKNVFEEEKNNSSEEEEEDDEETDVCTESKACIEENEKKQISRNSDLLSSVAKKTDSDSHIVASVSKKLQHSVRSCTQSLKPSAKVADSQALKFSDLSDKYSTWIPPENQSGDGKTKLNDKYGY